MKFDKRECAKEFAELVSLREIFIDEDEFPQLAKLLNSGNKAIWNDYFKNRKGE